MAIPVAGSQYWNLQNKKLLFKIVIFDYNSENKNIPLLKYDINSCFYLLLVFMLSYTSSLLLLMQYLTCSHDSGIHFCEVCNLANTGHRYIKRHVIKSQVNKALLY